MKWFCKMIALWSRNKERATKAVLRIRDVNSLFKIAQEALLYQARLAAVDRISSPDVDLNLLNKKNTSCILKTDGQVTYQDVLLALAHKLTDHVDSWAIELNCNICLYIAEKITASKAQFVYAEIASFLSRRIRYEAKRKMHGNPSPVAIGTEECLRIASVAIGCMDEVGIDRVVADEYHLYDPRIKYEAAKCKIKRQTDQRELHKLAMNYEDAPELTDDCTTFMFSERLDMRKCSIVNAIRWEQFSDKSLLQDIAANAKGASMREKACTELGGHIWGKPVSESVHIPACGKCRTCCGGYTEDWVKGDCGGERTEMHVKVVCSRCGTRHYFIEKEE